MHNGIGAYVSIYTIQRIRNQGVNSFNSVFLFRVFNKLVTRSGTLLIHDFEVPIIGQNVLYNHDDCIYVKVNRDQNPLTLSVKTLTWKLII